MKFYDKVRKLENDVNMYLMLSNDEESIRSFDTYYKDLLTQEYNEERIDAFECAFLMGVLHELVVCRMKKINE